jgi:ATP-dependent DNA ligase
MLVSVTPGNFVRPPRAALRDIRSTRIAEVWRDVGHCLVYPKADGWRLQVHVLGDGVRLFSRTGVDWAAKLPGIARAFQRFVGDGAAVLDVEAVALDARGAFLEPEHVPTAPQHRCFILDVLYLHGADRTRVRTERRVLLLHEAFGERAAAEVVVAAHRLVTSSDELRAQYDHSMAIGHQGFDGLIVKRLSARYFDLALKLKPKDTIDAVVTGAERDERGEIVRLAVAVRASDGGLTSLGHVHRTEVDAPRWAAIWAACERHVAADGQVRLYGRRQAIQIAPQVVVRVDVTTVRGLARYLRGAMLREDKGPEEATTLDEVDQIAASSIGQQLDLFDSVVEVAPPVSINQTIPATPQIEQLQLFHG